MAAMTRRQVIGAGLAIPFISGHAHAANDQVRFGMLHPNLVTVIHAIAKHIGAYEKHGIDIVEQRFKSGQATAGVEQLWRGQLDFYMGGAPEIPRLNSRLIEAGSPPPLAVISGANPGHTSLVLSTKLRPASIDELLKQKIRIAVSSLSSVHRAFFRGYLKADKQVNLDDVPWQFVTIDGGSMVPALLTNQIDAFLHSEPTTTIAILNNAGHLLLQAARGDMGPNPPPNTFLTTRRDLLAKNPDLARRFLRAIFDANEHYARTKDQIVPVIAEWGGEDTKVILSAAERMNPTTKMSRVQAQKWWDFIGTALIDRGELTDKMQPFSDVFELDYQPSSA